MTVVFVAVLSVYRFPDTNTWALPTALALFIVAALTDALDGYLARKWQVVSVFGRIMDPFADKVLILGAFVMLAGPGFYLALDVSDMRPRGQMSGVASWMAIVILARELVVTTIRAVLESQGVDFSASLWGKLKMIVQSIAIPVLLLLVMLGASVTGAGDRSIADAASAVSEGSKRIALKNAMAGYEFGKMTWLANLVIASLVTLITAVSAIPYITRAITALRKPADG